MGPDEAFSFHANKYVQGLRVVYGIDLTLRKLVAFLPKPDAQVPTEGNRSIVLAHAVDFGNYIREFEQWVSPAMLLRVPSVSSFVPYESIETSNFGKLSFSTEAASQIHILDGQHRTLGVHLAFEGITYELAALDREIEVALRLDPGGAALSEFRIASSALRDQMKRLENERVSVQIFVENEPKAYRQMFFDIAENARGITASVRTRFDSRKVVNRALEMTTDHPLLEGRVNSEDDRVGNGTPYILAAKHVAEIIRTTNVGLEGRISRAQELSFTEENMASNAKAFLSVLQRSFSALQGLVDGHISPDQLRHTSLLRSVLFIRALGGAYYELSAWHEFNDDQINKYFQQLDKHSTGPIREGSLWMDLLPSIWELGAFAPRSRRQDLKALKVALVEWALNPNDRVSGPQIR